MTDFGWLIGLAGLVIIGIPAMVAMILYSQIKAYGRPDLELLPADRKRHGKAISDSQSHDAWFVAQGFDIVACSTLNAMRNVLITAWQHRERPSYICIYHVANQRNYDIVTRFSDDIVLTTGSTADGMLLPQPPSSYIQCFVGRNLKKMWEKHGEAERFLMEEGATLSTDNRPFDEVFIEAIHRQSEHVQTIPFWPLRGLYWYLIRRKQLSNKTVRQLVTAGVYPRPSEIVRR